LIVDDDEIIRKGISKIIERSDLEDTFIKEASDGSHALEILEEEPEIDLMITDIRMPVMDGLELIRQVRGQELPVKIIVLSGFDDFEYVHNAFVGGVVDYLLKPLRHADLIDLIKRIELSIQRERYEARDLFESNSLVLSSLLDKLFHGKIGGGEEYERLKKLKVSLEVPYLVAITRPDAHNQAKDFQKRNYEPRLKLAAEKIEEWFLQYPEYQLHQYLTGFEVISLIQCKKTQPDMGKLKKFHPYLLSQAGEEDTYTTGVGNPHHSPQEAPLACQEAMEAADIRFYQGTGHWIAYQEVYKKCIDMQYDLEPGIIQLIHFLELCDYVNTKRALEKIFVELSYLKPHKFRKYMKDLLDMLFLRVKDFESAVVGREYDYRVCLEHINTYNELKAYLLSLLQGAIVFIRNERVKRSKKRIEMAKAYIREHYMEQLNLNDVAEYVELNSSYFSNLFKAEVGINFSDYLLDIRMEMAKKYLRNPKIRIYEIGNMIGYEDAVSFGRAFKKKVCMSPKEYRNAVY
jgi:two-component system response regulator YesN